MQQLMFETSWDKAIAEKDRIKIEQKFHQQAPLMYGRIHIVFYKKAVNYKGQILIMTIIHNGTEEPLIIENTPIEFVEEIHPLQETFTVPCTIPANTSMPWTFIFNRTKSNASPVYKIVFEHQL